MCRSHSPTSTPRLLYRITRLALAPYPYYRAGNNFSNGELRTHNFDRLTAYRRFFPSRTIFQQYRTIHQFAHSIGGMHHPLLLQDRGATNPLEIGMRKSLTLVSCRIPTDNLCTSNNRALLKDNSASMPATNPQERARTSNFEDSLFQASFLAHHMLS